MAQERRTGEWHEAVAPPGCRVGARRGTRLPSFGCLSGAPGSLGGRGWSDGPETPDGQQRVPRCPVGGGLGWPQRCRGATPSYKGPLRVPGGRGGGAGGPEQHSRGHVAAWPPTPVTAGGRGFAGAGQAPGSATWFLRRIVSVEWSGSRWWRLGLARQAGEGLRSRSALPGFLVCRLAASAQRGRFATPAVVTAASRGRLRRGGGLIPKSQVPSWPWRLALGLASIKSCSKS